ncbi:MAG: prolyl-tRNA synthetase associated domain-containing protein [Patescibacteria group bacterium]|nr:prolyl-tRNA synthetase associated domain-containing protein [Patescibacteria group bacterium]
MQDIYQVLTDLTIPFEKFEHPAVHTVADTIEHYKGINAGKSKNLFLRNAKGDQYFLVIMQADKRLDTKKLSETLGTKLSFASPEILQQLLGLTPGSVSPFGLINDTNHVVQVLVDKSLLSYETLGYHPNSNTATLVISSKDLQKFLMSTGNKVSYIEL